MYYYRDVNMTNFKNKYKIYPIVLLLLINIFMPCVVNSSPLQWPPITREAKPWTRWWWMGSSVNKKDLTKVMEAYQQADLGGLEITPIYGVMGYEEQFINYLSPEWMELFVHTLREAERLDLGIDIATGTGWPFGGPWIGETDACKNVVYKTYKLKGGEKLHEAVSYIQPPMVRTIRRRLDISALIEPISANKNLQALALEQVRFEKPLPLQVLMAYSDKGESLDIASKVNENGLLDWTAPLGNWTLYAVFQGWHGKMVERAAPGGEGNVINHFSELALKNYLQKFDMAFSGHDNLSIRAFFNDSYEVDDAAGEADYTPDLFKEFKNRRGYDLKLHLPALFGNDTEENNERVRCDYRETIADLLLEKFTLPWKAWAKGKGAIVRNQAHGSPANILDLYAASDIPETEGNEILRFKFASSAAHVTGKSLTSSESATWLKEHFSASLADVKEALDQLFLGGVNHVFYHGTPYSPPDEKWPGWLFYAAVHFGPTNSFWKDFPALNQYVTNCQTFLQSGTPDNDVLLYFPIYDKWSEQGRTLLQHFTGGERDYQGTSFQTCAETMWQRGYAFDIISDRQLANVQYQDNAIQTKGGSYQAILLPACRLIPVNTFEKLVQLAQNGAAIVVHDSLPTDVPGLADLDARREHFNSLLKQLDFSKAGDADVEKATVGKGYFVIGNDIDQLLSYAGIRRESMVDNGLQFIRRHQSNGTTYFIVNTDEEAVNRWIPISEIFKSAVIFNPTQKRNGLAAIRLNKTKKTEVYLQLSLGESCILNTLNAAVKAPFYRYVERMGQPQQINGTWSVHFINGGPELPAPIEISELSSWTNFDGEAAKKFSGTALYRISFQKPEESVEGWLLDLGRVCESAQVLLNGDDLDTLISAPYQIMIDQDLLQENNVLEIKVSNLMANRIADLDRQQVEWKKFYNINFPARERENRNEQGLFDASHWLPRDSGLIGPVTLVPIKFMGFKTE
jgi:hypothetical protein